MWPKIARTCCLARFLSMVLQIKLLFMPIRVCPCSNIASLKECSRYAVANTCIVIQGSTTGKPATGSWAPKVIIARGKRKLAHLIWSHRRVTVAQIASKVKAGYDRKWDHSLLHMGLQNCRLSKVPMPSPVHCWKYLQWPHGQNWPMEQWRKMAWSEVSYFLPHHVDGRVCVRF